MIAVTYVTSGVLLAVSAFLFNAGALNAITQTVAWCVIFFFFASAGASSAYLTVSEIFPMEVRAKAIAVFFAIAQCFGAIAPKHWAIAKNTAIALARTSIGKISLTSGTPSWPRRRRRRR